MRFLYSRPFGAGRRFALFLATFALTVAPIALARAQNTVFLDADTIIDTPVYADADVLVGALTPCLVTVAPGAVLNGDQHSPNSNGGIAVYTGSTLDITGGTINAATAAGGTIHLSGGSVFGVLNEGGVLGVAGGSLTYIIAGMDSATSVSGGTISYIYAFSNAAFAIGGGAMTTVSANNTANVTVTGGTFSNGLSAYDQSQLTVTGSNLTVTSSPVYGYYNGSVNYLQADHNVTGTLSDGSAISTYIHGAATYTGDANALVFHGDLAELAPDRYFVADGSVNEVVNTVVVGQDITGTINASPTVTLQSGADAVDVYARNSSVAEVQGIVRQDIYASENSAVTVNGGTVYSGLHTADTSSAVLNSGSVYVLDAQGNSAAAINGGTAQYAYAADNAALTMTGGDSYFMEAHNNAHLTLSGGSVQSVYANDSAQADVSGNATITYLTLDASTIANVSGGNIDTLTTYNQSVANLSGGTFTHTISAYGDSVLNMSGGTISPYVFAYDHSVVTFYGSNLTVTGTTSESYWDGSNNHLRYTHSLTGALTDGSALATTILAGKDYFGDSSALIFNGTGSFTDYAPDRYYVTDDSLNEIVNRVTLGHNESGTITDASPIVAFVAGADTGDVTIYNASVLNAQGGEIHGTVYATDNSVLNLNGATLSGYQALNADGNATVTVSSGTIQSLMSAYGDSHLIVKGGSVGAVSSGENAQVEINGGSVVGASSYGTNPLTVRGGSVGFLTTYGAGAALQTGGSIDALSLYDNSAATISGGAVNHIALSYNATLTFQGSGLSVTSGAAYGNFDGLDNYSIASHTLTGNLSDGSTLNQTFAAAKDYAGDASSVTFRGTSAQKAPDLYLTHDATVSDIVNHVTIGRSADGNLNSSPTVTLTAGTDAGFIKTYNHSVTNINGGLLNGGLDAYDDSVVNHANGTGTGYFYLVSAHDNATINFSGGTANLLYADGHGQLNVSGGEAAYGASLYDQSEVVISGGNVYSVYLRGESGAIITGGLEYSLYGYDSSLFCLYGDNLALLNQTPAGNGFRFDLTGTLLDGSSLNGKTLYLYDTATIKLKGGGTQNDPLLPDQTIPSESGDIFVFTNTPSGVWVDPPLVSSFAFLMTSDSLFTNILELPLGIGDADGLFTVAVGNRVLGQFAGGASVSFAEFGYALGVSGFTVSGIDPQTDAANPAAFPIRLAYNTPLASFTMRGIPSNSAAAPEPATLCLLLLIAPAALFWRRRA